MGNYYKVKQAIEQILDQPNYDDGSIAPVIVRLSWHSSGTYSKYDNTGGSNGATMRFRKEADAESNSGLEVARFALESVKKENPWISYADLYTYAGAVAIEHMGGPHIPWRPGRSDDVDDTRAVRPGRLPNGDHGPSQIRKVFNRMGFNDQEIVALIGCHCIGRTHMNRSSFDGIWTPTPTRFTNDFFKQMYNMHWNKSASPAGRMQYYNEDKSLMMMPSDMALFEDESFRKYVKLYAEDEQVFFHDFAKAFSKLLELGCHFKKPHPRTRS